MRVILDAKYVKAYLHKVMETQYQISTIIQHNEFLKLLQEFEEFFGGTLGTCKTYPVNFELKSMQSQYARYHTQYRRYMRKCSKIRLMI